MSDDIIEQIAKRWFYYNICPTKRDDPLVWTNQPQHIKDLFIANATEFWEHPGDRYHINETLLHRAHHLEQLASYLGDQIRSLNSIKSSLERQALSLKTEYHYKKAKKDQIKLIEP